MSNYKRIIRDPGFWGLILFNLIVIIYYRDDKQYYTTVVWLFWLQSMLIGIFNFLDMLTLQKTDTSDLTINNKPATPGEAKGCLSFFFLIHYGFFHLGYFLFLAIDFRFSDINFSLIKWAFLGLLMHTLIQFILNKTKYSQVPRSISKMFFMPYLRIIPMHLTILLPKFLGWQPGLTFLLLKFGVDIISHILTTPYYKKEKMDKPESFV